MFLGCGYLQLHPKAGVEFRQLALETLFFIVCFGWKSYLVVEAGLLHDHSIPILH